MTIAQSETDSKNKVINQIFESTAIEDKLSEVAEDMHSQFSQNPFGLPTSKNEQMMDLFLKAFTTDSLISDARNAFANNYNSEYANTTIQRMNTNEIQKVLEAEQEFYAIQGIRKRVVNKHELEQNPPSDTRNNLIQSLSSQRSDVESEIESQVIIFRALVNAFSEISNQRSFNSTQIEQIVNNFRNQSQPEIDREVTEQLLLMYHGLQNDLLKKEIKFYETDAGNWLSNTTAQSMHAAYQSAADRFITSIQNL